MNPTNDSEPSSQQTPTPLSNSYTETQQQTDPKITDPGKAMSIIGFILSFLFLASIAGLILSIIAAKKSKKAGLSNGLATAGIVIGSIVTVLSLIIVVLVTTLIIPKSIQIAEQCRDKGANFTFVNGERFSCHTSTQNNVKYADQNTTNISDTPVTLNNSKVESACYTFDMPAGYILSPESSTCQVELRMDNGSSSGIALTAILIKGQIGESTVDSFVDQMKSSGTSQARAITLNGTEVGFDVIKNGIGIEQAIYFIPDSTKKFTTGNGSITSYLIYGPSGSDATKAALSTVTESFAIRKV